MFVVYLNYFIQKKIFDLYNNFDKYAKKYSIFIAGNSILFSLDRKRKQMCKYEVRHFRSEKNKYCSIREYSYPIYTKKYGFFDNWWNFNIGTTTNMIKMKKLWE